MRKSMMRIKKIMAGVLAAALVAAGTPVYANVSEDSIAVDEVEESAAAAGDADGALADEAGESAVSSDEAMDEMASEEAVPEDAVPDESLSEDAVVDETPSYQLKYENWIGDTLVITGYTGEAKGNLIIPDTIEGKKVGKIESYVFDGCSGFTGDLVIPDSVTTIGQNAFSRCTGFNGKLVLPESLKTIEEYAFNSCNGFTGKLVLPESLTTIGHDAFNGCRGFTGDLVIPDGVTTIGDYAFTACYGFDGDLVIPDSVTTIGDHAFQGCSGFTGDLVIPDSVTTIGDDAFQGCSGFTGDLVIPDSVTTIGDYAFCVCAGFTGNLVISESVTNIGDCAFDDCAHFTGNLVIPEGVTTIGNNAFRGCLCFDGGLVIPDSVTTIGTGAFSYLRSIRMVTNRSGVNIPLSNSDSDGQNITWIDAATGETITSIANGTAIRSDAYTLSNEDTFTHMSVPDAVYTGKKIMPDITVYHGMNTLRKNKDYKITFSNNINAGTATFTITGKALYKGTATDTFNILEKDIRDDDVKISEISMVRENGKTYTPVPTITYNKKKLKKGTDFTVKYYREGNLSVPVTPASAGKYIAHIEGINNFKETVDLEFEITPAAKIPVRNLTVAKIPAQKYTGGAIEPEVTVKNGKKVLKPGEDYTVEYEDNKYPGTAKVIIIGVRKKGYAGKRTVTFKIVGSSITKAVFDGFVPSFTYDGTPKPQDALKLYKDKSKAESGKLRGISEADYKALGIRKVGYDYTYSYAKNTDAGTAVMTITGVNGWTGKVKKTYKILPFDIKKNEGGKASISLNILSCSYTGTAIKPKPVVKYDGRTLTEGTDYTLSYANNVAVNDGKGKKKPAVKVTGKGNFKGTGSAMTFAITKADMGFAGLEIVTGGSVSNNKRGNWKAKVDVITPNGKKLKQGKDYTVRYTMDEAGETPADPNAALPAGTTIYVHVTATEKCPYKGELKDSYKVSKYDITKLSAVVAPKRYTGKAVEITESEITWKSGKKVLKDVKFTIDDESYLNNTNPGTASVRVRGKDDYSGTKTVTYRIATRKILWWWI